MKNEECCCLEMRVLHQLNIGLDELIVLGKRSITADTDLRLCRFFGLSKGYWLRTQAAHDTEVAEETLGKLILKIKPWSADSAQKSALADACVVHTAEAD